MVKRLLVVVLIASLLVLTRAGEASACSCASLPAAQGLESADAAFVGTLVDRPLLEMPFTEDAPFTFEVEAWVKGDLGLEVVVFAPNQGSACGFEAPLGERMGIYLSVENGKASGNMCGTVDPDLLLAGERPLAVDGSGPPAFLVAGYQGPGRLMLIDTSGGLLASIGGSGESLNGLAVCPGKDRLVEMMNDQLIVRSTVDLVEVRRVDLHGLSNEVAVSGIWCRDHHGEDLWLATDEWTEQGGNFHRLFGAEDLTHPNLEGEYGWLSPGNEFVVAGEGPTGKRIWRIDLAGGDRTILHEIPIDIGDSEPFGLAWVDPSGERALVTQWRYRDDTGGHTTFFLYELATGDLLWQSEPLPTADGLGWVDDTTFHAYSYPDMDSDVVEHLLIDTERQEISRLAELPGWQNLRVGDDLVGAVGPHLRVMPIEGGTPVELRLLPSESHYLAAVLQPDATVTPTTQFAATVPTVTTVAAASEGREVEATTNPWLLVAAVMLLLIGLVAVASWHRRHPRPT